MKQLALLAVIALFATGCAGLSFSSRGVPFGSLYVDSQTNEGVTENGTQDYSKHGEACATSILGWVVTGDASVSSAASEGGISEISIIDSDYSNILGLYASYCVHVYGN